MRQISLPDVYKVSEIQKFSSQGGDKWTSGLPRCPVLQEPPNVSSGRCTLVPHNPSVLSRSVRYEQSLEADASVWSSKSTQPVACVAYLHFDKAAKGASYGQTPTDWPPQRFFLLPARACHLLRCLAGPSELTLSCTWIAQMNEYESDDFQASWSNRIPSFTGSNDSSSCQTCTPRKRWKIGAFYGENGLRGMASTSF